MQDQKWEILVFKKSHIASARRLKLTTEKDIAFSFSKIQTSAWQIHWFFTSVVHILAVKYVSVYNLTLTFFFISLSNSL